MIEDNEDQEMLKEFIRSFKASLDQRLWIKLVKEEAEELEEALNSKSREEVLKEVVDLLYVSNGLRVVSHDNPTSDLLGEEELKETYSLFDYVANLLESVTDMFEEEVIGEAFIRVHKSNMSKLGDDGKPIFREDGKVLKGPNYKKPYLSDLV
jgi:phosphoribosyl-ATP pyrophosphohydrolase